MWGFDGRYHLHRGDAVEHMATLPPAVFDFSVFSPPFPGLYAYTDSDADIGNSEDLRGDAKIHLSFFYRQFARVLKPGRVVVVHVAQIPRMKRAGGRGLNDFRGLNIRLAERAGLTFEYDWLIRKNPQAQAIRGKAWELKFQGVETDRAMSRGTLCDYLLKFRAPGDNAVPIDSEGQVSRNDWIRWAEGAWFDIKENDTLNGEKGKERARGEKDTKHICPLQLEVIDRLVRLYSNPGEVVFSPFAGMGSELVTALRLGRRAYGCELKPEYQDECERSCAAAATNGHQMTILDGFPDMVEATQPTLATEADPEPALAAARDRVVAGQQLPAVPAEEVLAPLNLAEPERTSPRVGTLEAALHYALHRFQGCRVRWPERVKTGLSDEDLKAAIGEEFGTEGGGSGVDMKSYCVRGGKSPAFWWEVYRTEKPTLTGSALVKKVRAVMRIPYPNATDPMPDAKKRRAKS